MNSFLNSLGTMLEGAFAITVSDLLFGGQANIARAVLFLVLAIAVHATAYVAKARTS